MSDAQPTERKVTFGEVFGVGEYRTLFSSSQLAWIGDYMVKAAIMALVYSDTGSIALSAAAFALSYAPWLVGGPFLTTLAERYRYRQVMVTCDLARAGLIAVIALTNLPLPVILLLVFTVALLGPPGQAARSAALPLVLPGERVVLGIAINQSAGQATQVVGYFAGAAISIIDPRIALMINTASFLLSALILRLGLRNRPPAMRAEHRSHLLRETAEGFKLVFGTPALRVIAVLVFVSMLFAIVPEGLAIGWASELAEGDPTRQGFYQGFIMVANPLGYAVGVLLFARLLMPTLRRKLVPLLAVLGPLALVPAIANPQILPVVILVGLSGIALAGLSPTLNGMFVQILPNGFRARAFGVMQSGVQTIQGAAILGAGVLVGIFGDERLPQVVGFWSLAGVIVVGLLALRWPKPAFFAEAIARNEEANRAAEAAAEAEAAAKAEAEAAAEAETAAAVPAPRPATGTDRAGRATGAEPDGTLTAEAGTMER